ncbi:MAG: endonuclease [Oscillospiraceae bacterium]|nr:endonuclease [Oscillospiraceae bacterium]
MKKVAKGILKFLLILLLVVLIGVGGLLGWLTYTEYSPADVEPLAFFATTVDADALPTGESIDILSWNIGYAGLGAGSDFFMDGGKNSRSADKMQVSAYLGGIYETLYNSELQPDLILLQEVDTDSSRTYGIDETEMLGRGNAVHALNYSCPFVPIPLPPMGKVNSGLLTTTRYDVENAERRSLPCPFSWPLRIANLKRCLLVSYLPLEGTDKQLVLVNLHLEAYDDGEGKIAQTKVLNDFLQAEYAKGNYVIAGGDFNQIFPGGLDKYPNAHPELWTPGLLTEDMLPEGWSYAYSLDVPSCRLLNQPYDPSDTVNTQYYVIDGFILSPNVELELVENLDLGFADSDHNPVHISVKLAG